MAEIHDLNPTDASNTARFPENQAPSTVNNGARALEGLIARYFLDNDTSVVSTLSGSVVQITANRNSLTLTGTTSNYVANFMQAFTVGANPNTGPCSVNIDGVGPISLRDNLGASLSSSVLVSGVRALIVKDGTNDYFRLLWPDVRWTPDVITTRGDIIYGNSTPAAARLAVGAANSFLASDGTDVAWAAAATQAEQETGTAVNKPVTPGRQHFHLGHPKAVLILTTLTTTPTITALYNSLSTLTPSRTGTGDHTVTWTNTLTNPSVQITAASTSAGPTSVLASCVRGTGLNGTSVRIQTSNMNNSSVDASALHVTIYGDLA